MTQTKIETLEKEIESLKKDLPLMKKILEEAEKQKEKAEAGSFTENLYQSIKGKINHVKNRKKTIEKEIEFYKSLKGDKKVKFIFFKAGHRGFDRDEVKFMTKKLQQFEKEEYFELERINFEMSDEAILYATEKLPDKEAQFMWNFYWENQFDENDQERYEHGDLMIWNGKELVDENGHSIIK